MEKRLEKMIEDHLHNFELLDSKFKWQDRNIILISALMVATKSGTIDQGKLEEAQNILKEETGILSQFRGNIKLPSIVILSMDQDPRARLKRTLDYYQILREEFWSSEYLGLSALILADLVDPDKVAPLAKAGKSLYQEMKKSHPILTSSEDNFLALLLGLSNQDQATIVDKIEESYNFLKKDLGKTNHLQTASHILAFPEGPLGDRPQKLLDLFQGLEREGLGLSKYQDYSALASMSLGQRPVKDLVAQIREVDHYLEKRPPYRGLFGVGKKNRHNYASTLVGGLDQDQGQESYSALTATIAMVAAQQAAMMAVIVSTSMVASSQN